MKEYHGDNSKGIFQEERDALATTTSTSKGGLRNTCASDQSRGSYRFRVLVAHHRKRSPICQSTECNPVQYGAERSN